MGTTADEIKFGEMTRIAGQSEEAAMDVFSDAGKYRAYVSSIERGSSIAHAALSVGLTQIAAQAGGSPLTNRRGILIQNLGTKSIFIGATGVTTSSGIEIQSKTSLWLAISEATTMYAISTAATQDVRVLEVA